MRVDAKALVVALKTWTLAAAVAVSQSLKALDRLQRQGCRRLLFKYCSTFDSTDDGNIGPLIDTLLPSASRVVHANGIPWEPINYPGVEVKTLMIDMQSEH